MIILYIHKISTLVQSPQIIAKIAQMLNRNIQSLKDLKEGEEETETKALAYKADIRADRSGYILSINYNDLYALAEKKGKLL